jgi:hypothetical protein
MVREIIQQVAEDSRKRREELETMRKEVEYTYEENEYRALP